ncbi:MAG: alkaline phosphatase family protein [Capsulimonadales bacterium]|nr:alkaline phosphatase family protein [Capsulimonadales bacterium]
MSRRIFRTVYNAIGLALSVTSLAAITGAVKRVPPVYANDVTGDSRRTLPTGWRLRPAGTSIPLPGDMPLKFALTGDGRYLVVNTSGHHDQSLNVIDLATHRITDTFRVQKNWAGLSVDGETVCLSGGGHVDQFSERLVQRGYSPDVARELTKPVLRFSLREGRLTPIAGIVPEGIRESRRYISGITRGADGSLYVLDMNNDTVFRLTDESGTVAATATVGYRPYAAVLSPDGKTLAVSNWGDKSVSLLDALTLKEVGKVATEAHPAEMVYGKDGRLYVANGGANSVSVVWDGAVRETIVTALEAKAPIGSTPVAVAIAPDGKRLYVANAGNNNVAVVDISDVDAAARNSRSRVLGFIPTGWYPTAVTVAPDGKRLYIAVGKGMYSAGNGPRPNDTRKPGVACDHWNSPACPPDYIGNILNGAVNVVDVPDEKQLAAYTKTVRENMPVPPTAVTDPKRVAEATAAFKKIKHVLFIIKENRTYDQVFSDIPGGNGDPKLLLYGEKVTPNHHTLAKRTVLLDNLYCSGEVSEDGHEWCNSAYATDYKQKGWVNSYSERGAPEVDNRLSSSPAGYLWDNCKAHGVTYRSYGEYSSFRSSPSSRPVFTGDPGLLDHASLEWWQLDALKDMRDSDYAGVFVADLKKAERTGVWPQFIVMSLGEDHTNGLRAGAFSPRSCVAANDQGVGLIIDRLSHSRFWKETAVFIIEDDAQDGPDHVDAHRTIGLVISPFSRRNIVDSTLYTTNSMIRTIELILNLPPMTQFDEKAMPMYNCFTAEADLTPYSLLPPQVDLAERNPEKGEGARLSALLDFSGFDRADPALLNRILWEDAHPGVPMPAPVRSGINVR